MFENGVNVKEQKSFAVVKYRDTEKSSWPNTGFSLEKLFKVCINFSKCCNTAIL